MIYYFSGTGNSKYVAEKIANLMGEEIRPLNCCDIKEELTRNEESHESIGIIFPIYAWGLPKIVDEFISKMSGQHPKYLWTIMTHGDDMGYADKVMNKELKKVNLKLDAAISVTMPNTYVCLPGMDVDSDELADEKVRKTEERLSKIAEQLMRKESIFDVHRGPMPFTKTYILRPLFNTFLVTDKYFKTNEDCTKCGICAKNCPISNIEMTGNDSRPQWKGKCIGCLRCYHQCPNHAIQFGSMTKKKGQKKKLQ